MGWAFGGDGDDDARAVAPSHLLRRDPIPMADRVSQVRHLETFSS